MATYHVLNGSAILDKWREIGILGEAVVWDEALSEGPIADPLPVAERTAWAQREFGAPDALIERARRSAELLHNLKAGDRAVLWFEEDLFCQLNLVYLLSRVIPTKTTIELALTELPLGRRSADGLRRVHTERSRLESARSALARKAWIAYASPDPRAMERLLEEESFTAWPLLRRGLLLHLARFPAVGTGLDALEGEALAFLEKGEMSFHDLFAAFAKRPGADAWGFPDAALMIRLRSLATGATPLITTEGSPTDLKTWELSLTHEGRLVLAGKADRVALIGFDRWVGGVHVHGDAPLWRWDARASRLVLT